MGTFSLPVDFPHYSMARLVCFTLLALCGLAIAAPADILALNEGDARTHFDAWVVKMEKDYASNVEELEMRFAIFADNLEFIRSYNAEHTSHWLGLTAFADMTHAEFKAHYNLEKGMPPRPVSNKLF